MIAICLPKCTEYSKISNMNKAKSIVNQITAHRLTDYYGDLLLRNYYLSKNPNSSLVEKHSLIKDLISRIDSLSKRNKGRTRMNNAMKYLKRIAHSTCISLNQTETEARDKYFNILIICPSYPDDKSYGGEFIRSRVKQFKAKGLHCCVIAASARYKKTIYQKRAECDLVFCFHKDAPKIIGYYSQRSINIVTHSVQKYMLDASPEDRWYRSLYVYHGFESRNSQRLAFNDQLLIRDVKLIENISANIRKSLMLSRLFKCGSSHIFVSDFLRKIAKIDSSTSAINSHVIPNPINPIFEYRKRDFDGIRRIIMIRSFSRLNYGTDIAVKAIAKLLDSSPDLEKLITIAGTGSLYEEQTSFLRLNYPRICFINKHLTPEEMSELYSSHHIALCPTRFDTQGVTLCEAMLTGLVCITHALPAIKEYADSSSCYMAESTNYMEYGDLIHQAVNENAETLASIGKQASEDINSKFSISNTVGLEMDLILGGK